MQGKSGVWGLGLMTEAGTACQTTYGGSWLDSIAREMRCAAAGRVLLLTSALARSAVCGCVCADSSNGEAVTGLPRLCDPSPSPDSANGPSSAQQPGSNSSSRSQQRHVSFGELPPSVALLQAQFRQQRAEEEKYRRERSPEPCASLDSDLEDRGSPQEVREQQRQALCGQLKRSRDEAVGLAAGSDEEDSAMSRPALKEQELEADCAGSKRARLAAGSA